MLFDLHPITLDETSVYAPMTFPTCAPLLRSAGNDSKIVALGAACRAQPVGLALAELTGNAPAVIRSVYVVPARRGLGLGAALLSAIPEPFVITFVALGQRPELHRGRRTSLSVTGRRSDASRMRRHHIARRGMCSVNRLTAQTGDELTTPCRSRRGAIC